MDENPLQSTSKVELSCPFLLTEDFLPKHWEERCSLKTSFLRISKAKQRLAAHVLIDHPNVIPRKETPSTFVQEALKKDKFKNEL